MFRISVSILALLFSVCISTSAQCESDVAAIKDSWVSNWNSKQLDKLMGLYAPDAALLAPDGQRFVGADMIRGYFKGLMDSASVTVAVRIDAIKCSSEFGYANGTFDETIKKGTSTLPLLGVGGGVNESHERGNYLIVIQRVSGHWRIVQHASIRKPETPPQSPSTH